MSDKTENFVSVVTALHNHADMLASYLAALHQHLQENFTDFEILLVDSRSTDTTRSQINKLLQKIPSVRFLELTSNVDKEVALAAGMENAIGDFIVLHNIDEDPTECIFDLVQQCCNNSDIVIGVAPQRQSMGYKLIRPFTQWVLHSIGYTIPKNATGLRCLSRRAVNTVTQTGRFHHQFYVRINNSGYDFSIYNYQQLPGTSVRDLRQGIRQGVNLLVFNSTKPLRWMSGLGLFGSLLAFIIAAYSILVRLFKDDVIEGWTTLVLFTSMLFGILFIILAFLGEYLGRLLDDRSEHKDYAIGFELTSSVMLEEQRRNVQQQADT